MTNFEFCDKNISLGNKFPGNCIHCVTRSSSKIKIRLSLFVVNDFFKYFEFEIY